MPMKTKISRKRLLAGFLSVAMAFTLAAGILPGTGGGLVRTAEAAGGTADDYDSIMQHGDYQGSGQIVIQMLDSSIPGGDRQTKGLHEDLNKAFKDAGFTEDVWKDADVQDTSDLLPIGEGLARMDGRALVCYDVTNLVKPGTGGTAKWSAAAMKWGGVPAEAYDPVTGDYKQETVINNHMGKYRVKVDATAKVPYIKVAACLEPTSKVTGLTVKHTNVAYDVKHTADGRSYLVITKDKNDWLEDGHRYIFVEADDLNHTFYGYRPNVEGKEPDENKDKGWQLYVGWASAADGKHPNVHITYDFENNKTWHAEAHNSAAEIGKSYKTQPLHNEVMRGGFSFRVANMETGNFGTSPSAGDMQDSLFAVFNINSTAMAPHAYDNSGTLPKPADTSTMYNGQKGYGYVTVDANGDNIIGYKGLNMSGNDQSIEAATAFPAYREDQVLEAWKEYLRNGLAVSNGAKFGSKVINGPYDMKVTGADGKTYDYTAHDVGLNEGLFVMGHAHDGHNTPIIPCLVLKPDENGVVKTPGAFSLPAGNYLVLQIKAGDGMYIDENFQPIVSIGPWFNNTDIGYGNAALGTFGTNLDESAAMSQDAGTLIGKNEANGRPVAYVKANTGAISDITNLGNGAYFWITNGGVVQTSTAMHNEPGPTYQAANSILKYGDWIVNMDKGSQTTQTSLSGGVGSRRIPRAGYSRFTAYQTPVRGGVRFYIGDADDVAAVTAAGGAQAAKYVAEPQGDGELAGGKFRVYNNVPASFMEAVLAKNGKFKTPSVLTAGIDEVPRVEGVKDSQKKNLTFGTLDYQEYTIYKEAGTGRYFIEMPVDELPFGVFGIQQVSTGAGYGSWEGHEDPDWNVLEAEDYTPIKLVVRDENSIVPIYDSSEIGRGDAIDKSETVKKNEYDARKKYAMGSTADDATMSLTGGTLYLPQTIVIGGYTIDASGDDSFDTTQVKVTVKVFNISDHYVYVDKDGDGVKEKYPTSKGSYNQHIRGKAVSVDQVNTITANWPSCVVELKDMSLGDMKHEVSLLPYGTYMIAVTEVTSGYTPVTSVVVTDKIGFKDDEIQYTVKILDQDRIPLMATTLLDNNYQLDSVPWKTGDTIVDVVDLANLQDGVSYTAYGMLVDQLTGQMVPGTQVAVAENITGYKPPAGSDTGIGDSNSVQANLRDLLAKGETFSSGTIDIDSYGVWLYNMQDFAAQSKDTILPGLVNTALNYYTNYSDVTTFRERYHTPMIARLRYMAGDATSDTGTDLLGRQTVRLYYNNINVRNDAVKANDLEGRNLVSVVILCEGQKQPDALTAADLGSLMAVTNEYSVCIRNDLNDEEETVHVGAIDVEAVASYTGGKVVAPSETVKATVTYGNMEAGNDYKVTVKLRDGAGGWVSDDEGNPIEMTTGVFRATQATGTFEAVFDGLDVAKYNNQRLTAFARLDRVTSAGQIQNEWWLIEKGDAATMGYSAGDPEPGKNQVDIVAPNVRTVLSDKYGSKTVDFDNRVTLVDRVEYTDLIAGGQYESVMTLVDSTGVVLKDDTGKDLIFTKTFTVPATNTDGKFTVEIEGVFDGKGLLGLDIISFNDLYQITPDKKAHVAEEHELLSKEQTIEATGESVRTFFTTVARDDNSRTHYVTAGADVTVTDVVTLRNMTPAEKYVLKTEVASANTGKVLNQIEPVYTQVAADNDGDIKAEVQLNLNTNAFKGQTLVIYQTLYDAKEKEIIEQHTSNTDPNQMLYVADVDTVATGENGRTKRIHPDLVENEEVTSSTVNGQMVVVSTKDYTYETTIMDRVYYSNLVPGNEYKITTEVVTKKGGSIVGSTSQNYMPTSANGSFTAYIDLDVTDVLGDELVVYETITDLYSNQVVAVHKDLDDEDQTVKILASATEDPDEDSDEDPDEDPNEDPAKDKDDPNSPGANTGKNIQTGVAEHYGLFFLIAAILAAIAGGGAFWYIKKRKG